VSEEPHSASDLREIVEELRSYLSDQIPPLLAADSVRFLIQRAPEATTEQIQRWLSYQFQARAGTVPVADLVHHTLGKLYLLADLGLVPPKELNGYLAELTEALLPLCPPDDRELVRSGIARRKLGSQQITASSFPVGPAAPARGPVARPDPGGPIATDELAGELRRFSLLLSQLKPAAPGGAAHGPVAPGDALAPSLLAAAATSARDGAELGKYVQHLGDLGVTGTDPAVVVRTLAGSLPDWAPAQVGTVQDLGSQARALHRFVDLGEAPPQRLERFRELVRAVVEAFNAGFLGRAVALAQVSRILARDSRVLEADVERTCQRAYEALDGERLRALAQDSRNHGLLRTILELFPPLRPPALLDLLEDEPDRMARRLRLTLMEVHGPAARPAVLDRLENALADARPDAWFWQRNLLYLLHRLPGADEAAGDREVERVVQFSELVHHPRVVGEAILRLAQIRREGAERALRDRLQQVDTALAGGGASLPSRDDLERIRGLLITALLRNGTPPALRAVAEAALRRLRQGGDASSLADLRAVDLSADPGLVSDLLQALRERLPRRLLGVTLARNQETVAQIIDSLSATPAPAVRQALREVAERFPAEPFAQDASRVLAGLDAPPSASEAKPAPAPSEPSAPGLSPQRMEGDLQLFGLPNLLQTLAQSRLTGTLTLRDRRGATVASMALADGDLAACASGRLHQEAAFFLLLERPLATSFAFSAGRVAGRPGGPEPWPILPLLMEGMRRYDEYQRARDLVPDAAVLVPTGTRPTAPPAERDGAFVRDLWSRVKQGTTAGACEEALATDPFRVRTLLAHWLTEGAVAPSGPS
jgi:hypothetical protein